MRRGIPEPEFKPGLDVFRVVFARPTYGGLSSAAASGVAGSAGADDVLAALGEGGELSARELADELGLTVAQVRYRVRSLLASGSIVATAPSTSRERKYRLT